MPNDSSEGRDEQDVPSCSSKAVTIMRPDWSHDQLCAADWLQRLGKQLLNCPPGDLSCLATINDADMLVLPAGQGRILILMAMAATDVSADSIASQLEWSPSKVLNAAWCLPLPDSPGILPSIWPVTIPQVEGLCWLRQHGKDAMVEGSTRVATAWLACNYRYTGDLPLCPERIPARGEDHQEMPLGPVHVIIPCKQQAPLRAARCCPSHAAAMQCREGEVLGVLGCTPHHLSCGDLQDAKPLGVDLLNDRKVQGIGGPHGVVTKPWWG